MRMRAGRTLYGGDAAIISTPDKIIGIDPLSVHGLGASPIHKNIR